MNQFKNKLPKQVLVILIALGFLAFSYFINLGEQEPLDVPDQTSSLEASNFVSQSNNTISEYALKHIFEGNINRRGEATGFHHKASAPDNNTGILRIIKEPNSCGVYTAQVKIQGKTKRAYSSMFPDNLNKSEITSILISSYKKGKAANPSKQIFTVQTDRCFKMTIIENNGKLATAYPLY